MKQIEIKDLKCGDTFFEYGYGEYIEFVAVTDAKPVGDFGCEIWGHDNNGHEVRFFVNYSYKQYGSQLYVE